MFGLWNRNKLSGAEAVSRRLSLITAGCLFLSMCSRKINGNQYSLLFNEIQDLLGDSDQANVAYLLTDQLAEINKLPIYEVLRSFKSGRILGVIDKGSILHRCTSYALLEEDEDLRTALIGVTRDYGEELGIKLRHVKAIVSDAVSDINYQKVFGYQYEDSEHRLLLEKAIAKTYCPITAKNFLLDK